MREYYGYALCAGISVKDARRMMPGFIMDMFKIRVEDEVRGNGGKIQKRQTMQLLGG